MKNIIILLFFLTVTSLCFSQCPQVLDQNHSTSNTGTSGMDQWQSFTAGISGKLTKIDLNKNGIQSFNLTLSIYQGNGIGGALIYTNNTFSFTNVNNWISLNIPIGSAPLLTNGTQYTFRLQTASNIGFTANQSNVYTGGIYSSDYYGGVQATWDLNFKTYIQQDPPPVVNILSSTNPICFGSTDGTINTSISSGQTPYTFNWSPSGQITQNASGLSAGNHNLAVTDNLGCIATTSLTLVDPPIVTANAGTDLTICDGGSASIVATATNAINYSWSPGGNLSSTTTLNTVATPNTTTTYTLTATDAAGCSATDAVTVTVNSLPNVSLPAFGNKCIDDVPFTLSGGTPGPVNGEYFINGISVGPPGTTGDFDPNLLGTGSHNITYNYTDANGCIDTSPTVSVFVNPLPVLTASSDENLCINENINISASSASSPLIWDNGLPNGSSHNVSPASTTEYFVTTTDGNGCSNIDSVTITVNPLPIVSFSAVAQQCLTGANYNLIEGSPGGGAYTGAGITGNVFSPSTAGQGIHSIVYTYTDGTTTCQNTDTTDITVTTLPNIIANSTLTSTCIGTQIGLFGTGGVSYTWDNGVVDNIAFNTNTVGTTTYTVTGTDAGGCTNTNTINVLVYDLPAVDAGVDQTICENTEITLIGTGANSYEWSDGTNVIQNNATIQPGLGNTRYVVLGTDVNGCQKLDSMFVQVNPNPVLIVSQDQSFCLGDEITLNVSGADGYDWENGQSLADSYVLSPQDSQSISVTGTNLGCVTEQFIELSLDDPNNINAGVDQSICKGFGTNLEASGGLNYVWEGPGIIDVNSQNTYITVDTTAYYFVDITTDLGCVYRDSLMITAEVTPSCTVEFQNTISPNHDGVNDYWIIEGIEGFEQNLVVIYNRWGDIVFEENNYDNNLIKWEGTNSLGNDVIPGTYFYRIELTNGPTYSGWIELLR